MLGQAATERRGTVRRFMPLVAVAMAITIAAPVSAASNQTVYLALGDSLAEGDGASIPSETAYVPLMADYFAGRVHGNAKQSINLGVGGETRRRGCSACGRA